MFNYVSNIYNGIKKKFHQIKKAYLLKKQELKTEQIDYVQKEKQFLDVAIAYHNNKFAEQENFRNQKRKVKERYWDNIKRILNGKDLIQDEVGRAKELYASPKINNQQKTEKLEKKLKNYSCKNYSYKNNNYEINTNNNFSAKYISSFKKNCFTNQLANISKNNNGSIKELADTLAGYVVNEKQNIAPHRRTWTNRLQNLEEKILANNFSKKDSEEIESLKEALSQNKYLVKKKPKEYKKAISLLNKAKKRRYN